MLNRKGSGLGTATVAILVLLFLLGGMVQAQPTIPSTLTVQPGKLGTLTISTGGQKCAWVVRPETVEIIREYTPESPDITLRVFSADPTTAYFVCWSAKDSLPSKGVVCVITVGDSPDPTPQNDLTKAFQKGYDKDKDTDKKKSCAYLQAVYASAGSLLKQAVTSGQLFARLKEAYYSEGIGLSEGAIPGLRGAIDLYLSENLPSDANQGVDLVATRKLFANIATALKGVK